MKKHLLFNQSFGTVGSPNQTGETLTRENRVGLMSYLHRTLMLLFAVLVMSMANVGTAWGTDVFSAVPIAGSNLSAKNLTTFTAFTSSQATISGGTLSYKQEDSSDKGIINTSIGPTGDKRKCFRIETNKCVYKMVLSGALQNGDVIAADLYNNNVELWFSTSESRPGSAPSTKLASGGTSSKWNAKSYTVTTGDGICGQTTIYIHRNSNTTHFSYLTITRAAAGTTWYVKGDWNEWGTTDNLTGSGTELSATVNITTAGKYEFKIFDSTSSGTWWGNGGNIGCNVSGWTFESPGSNCTFFASETGNYTFTFNTSTKKLSVTYPTAQGKYYYKNTGSWSNVAVYRFKGDINNGWPGSIVVETEEICGDTYYFTYADPGTTLIFNNNDGGSQTGNMAASGNAGKYVEGTGSSWTNFPTYSVTYNANGDGAGNATGTTGSVPTDASSPYACGSTVTVLGKNTLAKSGYTFTGWNTAPGGGGTSYAEDATFTISANTTLYAQWEEDASYTVTYNLNGGQYNGSGVAPTQAPVESGTGITMPAKVPTKSNYVFGGWTCSIDSKKYSPGQSYTMTAANTTFTAYWIAASSMADGTLYKVEDMIPNTWPLDGSGKMTTTEYGIAGGSANGIFDLLGEGYGNDDSGRATPMGGKKSSQTVAGTAFANSYFFKGYGVGNPSGSTLPTARAIKFNIPSAGTLTIYVRNSSTIKLLKSGGSAAVLGSGSSSSYEAIVKDVTAGTYYLYATGGSTTLYGLQFDQGCTAPTGLTAASTTAKGTTFTITDGANTNDYEFYVSTSSTAPLAGATATHTSTSKTKAITDCVAGTTYYAWVRSKCGESNKSGWTALGGGGTFTTSTVSADYHLTNVTKSSGATSGIGGSTFTAVFASVSGYALPSPVVTIDGNAATSGTDYTWTAGTGTLTINADKITGNIDITMSSPAAAPTNVAISGTYHYYPGETISLTATPTGGNGPVTYQWYHGGTADGDAIDGATSATFTKSNCVVGDAGDYYCKVTCGGSASRWSDGATEYTPFKVKIMQFLLKDSNGDDIGDPHALVKGADAQHASLILNLTGGTTYKFRVTDGCGNWYGNSDATGMTSSNCTNWTMPHNADCKMTTGLKTANYTFNFDFTSGLLGSEMKVSIVYPGGNQAADKVIYWDNSVLNWDDGDQWYRIGKGNHHSKTQMTKVSGTANLYKVTTAAYDGFEYWHIANNQGNGDGNLFWTKGDADKAITHAMAFEGAPVTADAITITPTTSHATGETTDNDNCEFYSYGTASGMKTQNVAISPYSNGTITVNYTNTSNVASTLTSGNADLAHTVILTSITAVANTGYDASAITINGNAYAANHVVTEPTTIAASFTPHVYTITYLDKGGSAFSGEHVDSPNAHPTSHTYATATTLNSATKTGYTFGGWYTSSDCSTGLVTYLGATDYTADITLYAKWTAAASLTALECNTLYEVPDMIPSGESLTSDDQFFDGLSANTKFELIGSGSGSTTPKVNNNSSNDKTIDGIPFDDGSMWFKGTASVTDNIPTTYALSFIVPEGGGKLYLYFSGTSTNIKLAKSGSSGSKPSCPNGYGEVDVTAGTYYLYGTGTTAPYCFYGLKLSSKYSVSITTTNVTKATGDATAVHGKAYTATFTAPVGYTLPSDATVSIGGVAQTKGTGYTWTISDGTATLTVPAAKVTGAISIAVSGVAAESYSITYNCNGAESGCPSNVAAAYTLPSPLPTGLTKDGYDFGGWFTDSEFTVAAVAGAALTDDTDLYAKWTVHSASECITIAYFETTSHNNSSNLPDKAGKYIYGYTNSAKTEAYAYTITSSTGDNKGQGTGESDYLRMNYGTTVTIYADNTTTGGTPASFSNVTSVSVDFKMKSSSYYTSFDIYVGSTKIANNVSLEGAAQSAFTTFTYDNLEQLSGTVRIVNKGSGSSNYHFYVDNIVICTASMSSCTTPTLPTATLNDQALCEGADIATWTATPTNASTITGKGESISYSWKKKGSETVLGTGATFDLGNSATESQAGTYVVTVTVSKAGYTSATVSEEIELSVTDGIEVTGITADKATVYPTNSVTLTATASADASWQWYTCTNAEGAGEAIISGAESASYTIASAGAAGTYYYKAKATGSCGTGSMVYTLTVSAAAGGDCFHFVSVIPESNINISSGASIVTPTHATTLEGGTMKVGSQQVVITAGYGLKMEGTKTVSITLDAALEAGNVVIVKGTSGTKGYGITINGVNFYDADNKTFDVSYTVSADDGLEGQTALSVSKYSGSSYLQEVKITGCGTACTDPEVTASVNNSTACVGSSVTFTATGAHAEATYQWQKLNGTWTNISDETESTYTIASVVAGDAGKYRVIATNDCNRTSNEVTLSVPSAPDFGSTVPASVSVMQTIALSINTVEATDAVKYKWYKSANATWDAGDTEIGTNKELIKAYDGEAIGSPSYYIFCRAQNACGITTSSAIAVNVTAYVEEDCATRGNEGSAEFSFENSGCGQGSYQSANCWTMNSNSKILVYYPPTGKYFKTAKVTIASSSESKASYNWSTNGGTDYTAVSLTVNSTLTERTINLSTHGNVNAFQIGRNFDSKGSSGGTLYVSKICFEYTDACTATTVTPSTSSVNYEMGGAWSNPTFTLAPAAVSGETLTYSSSNEDIASVDDDGTVTFNGEAGTVTITASYAGGTISETEYCASSGSYTITVSCTGGAPKVVASGSVDMSGCNSSVTLLAKTQSDGDFADGTYQWFRNGEEIDGATNSSYTATQAGTYTVERTNTSDCTTPSTNSAVVTSETTEPEVERLVPFQYYHVDKTYSDQMKMRHLFAVKNSGTLDGKHFKMYVSRNGGAATDVTNSAALEVWSSADGRVDTVMVNLNELSGKYSANDELVFTCKAIDCTPAVSDVYKNTITMNVIGATPTLALICSGSSKAGGTRKTGELTVGGDFLTGYNVADLCQQTGNTSFDANTEWGLYTNLKTQYIVTPVNGYAVFNKLNYEPFDILLLTDYPKASKSDAAATILDDMAALCDYRPMLSFKTHMVAKSPSKWAEKGFTTSPVVTKADGRLNLNIVCYAHPMFNSLKTGDDVYTDVGNTSAPLVYTMLSGTGYESSKGMQGFELAAAENFVTIGLTHYNGTIAKDGSTATWTPGSEDRMLVTVAERQANPEARFILFSLNCGAQSKLTDKGEEVVLACLNYLLGTAEGTIAPADCSFTFDDGEGNMRTPEEQAINCPTCPPAGDHKWNNPANWGPDYRLLPGEFTSVRIKKPVEVNDEHAHVMEVRIIDEGSIDIPAGKALDVKSTIRRQDGTEIYPTDVNDIHIGSASTGNGTLIFNNSTEDTKAQVDMYSKGFIDHSDPANEPKGVKNYQYIGTPFNEVNALYNYYGSWIYYWKADGSGWKAVKNGGPMTAWTGYCITQETPTYHQMSGTLAATGTVDINVPANANMVVGNSWTAPIDINAFTDDDFENLNGNVYFFNTGVDKTGEGTTTESATGDARWAGGTYVSVPIHAASYTGTDDHIPSMQGFFVKNENPSTTGALHLDYERHVRGTSRDNILSGQLHAPRRVAALNSDEPAVLKMIVSGENYDDKLVLLAREDFTASKDFGWDGDKWDGNESALYLYTMDSKGTENSVSAVPELEGTIIGFRAGEDDAYTLNFEYLNSDETLYLYDVENNTYTQIMTGMTYRFFTTDNEKHERFIITRSNGQEVATGVESTSGSLDRSKAKKLLIEDKMFIIVNGMLYDATGKVVK